MFLCCSECRQPIDRTHHVLERGGRNPDGSARRRDVHLCSIRCVYAATHPTDHRAGLAAARIAARTGAA